MKHRVFVALLSLSFVLGAAPAHAVPLPFQATLHIRLGALPSITANGSGVGNFSGAGGSASIPAGVFSLQGTTALSPPVLVIDGFGYGAPGQGGTGQLPLAPGTNKALSFGGVTGAMGLNASAYMITGLAGPTPNNAAAIPLALIGLNGGCGIMCSGGGLVNPQVQFAQQFTVGMATVMGVWNGVPSIAMGTGFDNRTAGGQGVLQLVAPAFITMGALGALATMTTLTITITPEPSTALLVAGGLTALAAMCARRRSR